ncbi:MAG: putative methyl-accepting chemotaxis protein [Rhodospirillales bacterium]|nr:putative methyl-accepting chemotaxis protein [Rhodospirillales bacterium]
MSWLNSFSIRLKVLAAFGCVLVVVIGLGVIADGGMGDINGAAAEVRDHWLPATRLLGKIAQASERSRALTASLVISETDEARAVEQGRLQTAFDEGRDTLRAYEKIVTPGQERVLADDVVRTWKAYLAINDRAATLLKQHDGKAVTALFQGEARDRFGEFRAALQADIDFNVKSGIAAADHGAQVFDASRSMIIVTLGVAALLSIAAGALIIIGVARPIRLMTGAMNRLAAGDLGIEVAGTTRGDEVGSLARSLQVFKDNGLVMKRLEAEQAEVKRRAEAEQKAAMIQMADNFESSVQGVVDMVASASTQLQAAARSLSDTAEETSQQSTAVAAAVEQTSANVQTVAAASEELSVSIGEIGRQITQSTAVAGEAVEQANRTSRSVEDLAQAAKRIEDVIRLIKDIASQTNLLALNATIEAARAGEAGKGFAVVASEVKALANQTAQATEEIEAQISAIQRATTGTVRDISSIGEIIGQISQVTTAIAAAIEEQGAATGEITRNVQQAAGGTQEVAQNIVGVSAAAGLTGAAASQVLSSATELSQQAERMRREVAIFVAAVRSGAA